MYFRESVDVDAVRATFEKEGLVVVPRWLEDKAALRIASEIERYQDWNLRICDNVQGSRIVDVGDLKKAGVSAREIARSGPRATAELANGQFAYLFLVREPRHTGCSVLEDFGRWMHEEAPAYFERMTGIDAKTTTELLLTNYSAGCFLGQHTDGVQGRRLAFVGNFTKHWMPEWGGFLNIVDRVTGHWRAVMPQFNSLCMFDTRDAGQVHFVAPVANWVQEQRITVTGWMT